ncbi:unnamed protein product [Cunninghamella echinulata]
MILPLLFALLLLTITTVLSSDINVCSLAIPSSSANNVHTLHPAHIKVVASIGDSITAGVGAKNIETTFVSASDFKEYRGLSWLSGGDQEATSIANYIKYYSKDSYGSSTGVKPLKLCQSTFFCLDYTHSFDTDQLNAALPSATSYSIMDQVNYLSSYIGKGKKYDADWKLVNIYIGTNDIAVSCLPDYTVEKYESNIRQGLELLKSQVNNVIVNIIGLSHIEKIPGKANNLQLDYQKKFEDPNIDPQKYECVCCQKDKKSPLSILDLSLGKVDLAENVDQYNQILTTIAQEYGKGGSRSTDTFTVVYQPFSIDIDSLPVDALSNIDGYHPNIKAYRYFATKLWNEMFLPKSKKSTNLKFDEQLKIFCPNESDYIRTD